MQRAIPVVPAPSPIRTARVPPSTRKCRFCTEVIHAADRICSHCGGVLFQTPVREPKLTFVGGLGMLLGVLITWVGWMSMTYTNVGVPLLVMLVGPVVSLASYAGARR